MAKREAPKYFIRSSTGGEQYAYNDRELKIIEERWVEQGRLGVVYERRRLFGTLPFAEEHDAVEPK